MNQTVSCLSGSVTGRPTLVPTLRQFFHLILEKKIYP